MDGLQVSSAAVRLFAQVGREFEFVGVVKGGVDSGGVDNDDNDLLFLVWRWGDVDGGGLVGSGDAGGAKRLSSWKMSRTFLCFF